MAKREVNGTGTEERTTTEARGRALVLSVVPGVATYSLTAEGAILKDGRPLDPSTIDSEVAGLKELADAASLAAERLAWADKYPV